MHEPITPAPPNETGTGCAKLLLWSVALLTGAGFWVGQNEWLGEVPVHLAAQRALGQIDAATYQRLLGQHRLAELGWVAAWVLLWGAGIAVDAVWTRRRGQGRHLAGLFMLLGLTALLAGCGPAVPTVTPVGASDALGWVAVATATPVALPPTATTAPMPSPPSPVATVPPRVPSPAAPHLRLELTGAGTVPPGHTSYVFAVAFSPDGQTLATASGDLTIKFWDVAERTERATLRGHTKPPIWLAFAPDGHTLASAGEDGTIRLWSLPDGRPIRTLTGHGGAVTSVAFSPDGTLLAGTSSDFTLRLWDAATGALKHTLGGYSNTPFTAVFSPDGQTLASTGEKVIKLWRVATGQEVRTLTGHTDFVNAVAFSPDGTTLVSTGVDDTLRTWDPATGQQTDLLPLGTHGARSLAFSPDGRTLAVGTNDDTIRLRDLSTGTWQPPIRDPRIVLSQIAFSPDGRTLAAAADGNRPGIWDVTTGQARAAFPGRPGGLDTVAISPDGQTSTTGARDGTITLRDAEGRVRFTLPAHKPGDSSYVFPHLAFSPDSRLLASGDPDGTVRLWDAATGQPGRSFAGKGSLFTPAPSLVAVAFSPDGGTLVAGSVDGRVRLWDVRAGRERLHIQAHAHPEYSAVLDALALSPDGRVLATAGWYSPTASPGGITLWDAATGRALRQVQTGGLPVQALAFSPDGRSLIGGNPLRVWDVDSGKLRDSFPGTDGRLVGLAVRPDGQVLVTAGEDGAIRLWEIGTGAELFRTDPTESAGVQGIALAPDGGWLLSAQGDGRLLRWTIRP